MAVWLGLGIGAVMADEVPTSGPPQMERRRIEEVDGKLKVIIERGPEPVELDPENDARPEAEKERLRQSIRERRATSHPTLVLPKSSDALVEASARAREYLDDFRFLLDRREYDEVFMIYVLVEDGQGARYVPGDVVKRKGDQLQVAYSCGGLLGEHPVQMEDIADWVVYHTDGSFSGGYLLREKVKEMRREGQQVPEYMLWIEKTGRAL